jgi:hypothetical protein
LEKEVKIGQQVVFVMDDGKTERPAIITNVFSQESGCANLMVFIDGSNDSGVTVYTEGKCYALPMWATSVSKADPCPATGAYPARTWHWPV